MNAASAQDPSARSSEKTVLVTGASGTLGSAIALRLASNGYRVCAHYALNKAAAENVVAEIISLGGAAFAWQADLGSAAETAAMFREIKSRNYSLGALVNNAATIIEKPLRMLSDQDITQMLEINVLGAFRCLREGAKLMSREGCGAVVNIGSLSHLLPLPGQIGYSLSKAALVGMTRAAALELAAFSITVNAVEPGPLMGGMQARMLGRGVSAAAGTPLGGLPTPESVAECVAFLCSAQARWITGQVLTIDGGLGLTTAVTFRASQRPAASRNTGEATDGCVRSEP